VLAALFTVLFAALVASLLTDTFALSNEAVAWVGTGLVGLAAIVLAAWAAVLHTGAEMEWAERAGGDLLLAGVGIGLVAAGLPTFAAGVL
jgi:hypothetical protein